MQKIVKHFDKVIIGFYIYTLVFPTMRLLLLGSEKFKDWTEFFITASPDIITVLIAVFAVILFWRCKKEERKISWIDWLFVAYYTLTIAWGTYLSQDVFLFASGMRTTYIPMLFYFVGRLLYIVLSKDENGISEVKIERFLSGIFFSFIMLAVVGIIIYFFFPGVQKAIIESSNHIETAYFIVRMTSIVWTPVVFGFIMAITCMYYYYRVLAKGSKLDYLFLSIAWFALTLSVCRGGMIAFLLSFGLITLIIKEWRKAIVCIVLLALISCCISLFMVGSLKMVLWVFSSSTDTMQLGSGITRVSLWQESVRKLAQKPGGYGLGKAGWTAFTYLKNSSDAAPYTTDGWYLKTACETGVYGLIGYIIMTGIYFFTLLKYSWNKKVTFVTVALAMIVIVHFQNMVSNVLDFHPYISVYWLLLGLAQSAVILTKRKEINTNKD